jgi:glycosyltransferase involved in cell wall biosynthesis
MVSRIAIEASSASSGGAIRYLSGICPALAEASPNTTYYLLNRASQFSRLPPLPDNFHWVRIPDVTKSVPVRLLWLQTTLPRNLKELQVDVLLAASDISTLRPPCPLVLMAHNFNPFSPLRGQIWGRKQIARMALHRGLIRRCAHRADKVVFVSEWSQQAMSPALGIPSSRAAVVHHGVDGTFRGALDGATPPNSPRFLLVVSEVLEHKNLSRMVEAYCDLTKSLDEDLHLVIAGPIGSAKLRHSLEQFLAEKGLLPNVKFLGFVPGTELAALYYRAELLVFPSLVETFGLPLIEAMSCGLPVVASNASSIPEVCEDAACYFDPLDVDDMTRAMAQVLTDSSLRRSLSQRGLERAAAFSWDKAAQRLLSVINAISGKPDVEARKGKCVF